jgi:2-phosphosulfolactate phosphatase
LEDSVCAGKLIEEINKKRKNIEVSDSSAAAFALYERFGNDILKMLKNTEHGKKLLENGFEEDLEFCSKLNINSVLPYFDGIKLKSLDLKKSKMRS